jgi:hypothetical protein
MTPLEQGVGKAVSHVTHDHEGERGMPAAKIAVVTASVRPRCRPGCAHSFFNFNPQVNPCHSSPCASYSIMQLKTRLWNSCYNVNNLEQVQAVMEAAHETARPSSSRHLPAPANMPVKHFIVI